MAASRPQLEVVGDQRGSPTYSIDLARAIIQLCRKEASGIVHATNRGECSWYEFAREIIAGSGLKTVVRETTSDKFVRPAHAPEIFRAVSRELAEAWHRHARLAGRAAEIPGGTTRDGCPHLSSGKAPLGLRENVELH